MLREYDAAISAAVERVLKADRKAREKIVALTNPDRETRFTSIFLTLLEEELNGLSDGGVVWSVYTHEPDKQSGQERDTGADMVIALDLQLEDVRIKKGFQAQAKINRSAAGLSVNNPAKLVDQCDVMLSNSAESFVFVYGELGTLVLPAISVPPVKAQGLSHLKRKTLAEFFEEFFTCWVGERNLAAGSHKALQELTEKLAAKGGAYIRGRSSRDPDGSIRAKPKVSPDPPRRRVRLIKRPT